MKILYSGYHNSDDITITENEQFKVTTLVWHQNID